MLSGMPGNSAVSAQEADPRISVFICKSEQGSLIGWRNTVSSAIGQALDWATGKPSRIMGDAECGAFTVEIACTAGVYDAIGPALVCSPYTLEVLVRMVGWYVLSSQKDEGYDNFRARQADQLGLLAMKQAMNRSDAVFEERLEQLRLVVEGLTDNASPDANPDRFRATLDLVFAAIFGHEGGHLEEAAPYCGVVEVSKVEARGLWQVLVRVAGSDELFRQQTLLLNEIRADRCAARVIQQALESVQARHGEIDLAFARRAAADIVAALIFAKPIPNTKGPVVTVDANYLYPPLRIIALTADLSALSGQVTICGGAAEILVQATQQAFDDYPGNGIMPDEIESVFPTAVVDAWEHRGTWSPDVYRCELTPP